MGDGCYSQPTRSFGPTFGHANGVSFMGSAYEVDLMLPLQVFADE